MRMLVMAGLVVAMTSATSAQPGKALDAEVKAAYLFNFGRFVRWPMPASGPEANGFQVCLLGKDPFGPVLDRTLSGETVDGVPVAIRRLARADQSGGCRILFISAAETQRLPAILTSLGTTGILTVSDMPRFAERGGMIQFVSVGSRIRFEVNLVAAEEVKLGLSADLLKVATLVRRGSRGE